MAHILITGFCSLPAPNRPGIQLRHVVDGLLRDHQVDVLSLRREEQAHVERVGACRILRVPNQGGDLPERIAAFRRALRRQLEGADYDVVQFRDGWSGITALEMQAKHKYATVFDVARSPMAEPMLTDLATATELERAEQACVRRADMVLSPSGVALQYLGGLTDTAKLHVVPPGVNVDTFDWEEPSTHGPPVILYLGSLTPGRGVRVLLRAMMDVVAQSDAVLVLAGRADEAFTASLRRGVEDLQLVGRVRLLGEVPHGLAASVIARSTVCVAPGAAELQPKPTALYPTKILEYMACRRATVAPRRGTVEMLMRDKEEGLLFRPGAPDDLADKLLQLIHDSQLRERVAEGGYELVRSKYTASGTRRCLRRAYEWLSGREQFRQRFARSRKGDSLTSSITDLGLDVGVASVDESEPRAYDGDTVMVDEPARRDGDGGDVTKVEVNPILGREGQGKSMSGGDSPSIGGSPAQSEEGTSEWEVPIDVELQQGDEEQEAGTESSPKTVITAPFDDSLVSGELQAPTPRPEQVKPVGQRAPAIPPAKRGASRPLKRKGAPGDEGHEQDSTRVVSLAMIEDGADEEAASKTKIMHKDEIRPIPKPPKLPKLPKSRTKSPK